MSKKRDKWVEGNPRDGKHYWLSPSWLWEREAKILGVTKEELFDPCPYPKPEGFDGLNSEWGKYVYLNPPFFTTDQVVDGVVQKAGITAWIKKALQERDKGNSVVIVLPADRWLHTLLEADELLPQGDVRWMATEDGSQTNGASRPIVAFVLRAKGDKK